MASPSTVLTRGIGSWGSVNEVVTLGYGIDNSVVTLGDSCCSVLSIGRPARMSIGTPSTLGIGRPSRLETGCTDGCG